jgi:hypothetical protein
MNDYTLPIITEKFVPILFMNMAAQKPNGYFFLEISVESC